jgi:hypothetical protein
MVGIRLNVWEYAQLVRVRLEPLGAERLAELIQALPERVARVFGVTFRPEDRAQRLARGLLLDRQVHEESRAQPLTQQPVQLAGIGKGVKPTQRGELDCHEDKVSPPYHRHKRYDTG